MQFRGVKKMICLINWMLIGQLIVRNPHPFSMKNFCDISPGRKKILSMNLLA